MQNTGSFAVFVCDISAPFNENPSSLSESDDICHNIHVNRLLGRSCKRYSYTITTLTMRVVGIRGYSDRLLAHQGSSTRLNLLGRSTFNCDAPLYLGIGMGQSLH